MLYSMVWSGVAWTINILAMLITDYYRICIIRFDGFRSISMFAFFALFFLFFSIVINFTHTLNLNLWIRHTDDWYFGMAMWMHRRILWKRRIEYWLEIPFFFKSKSKSNWNSTATATNEKIEGIFPSRLKHIKCKYFRNANFKNLCFRAVLCCDNHSIE